MLSLIIFIVILSFLVLIHEFGHFIVAKKNGILVEEFGIGLPPRITGIKIGETLYSINLLPFGGFVKLFGEEYKETEGKDVPKKLLSRTFSGKKPWQKVSVILAGVTMNLIIGILIYYILLSVNSFISDPLVMVKDHNFRFGQTDKKVAIISLVKNSPAEKSGFKQGDIIISTKIEDQGIQDIHTADEFKSVIQSWFDKENKTEPLIVNTKNAITDKISTYSVYPEYDKNLKRAVIGVGLNDIVYLNYGDNLGNKLMSGIFHSYNIMAYNYSAVFDLIKTSVHKKTIQPVAQSVSGPVGIFSVVRDIVSTSGSKVIVNLLNVTAILSLSLAVMNVLPLPALDGGRLVFIIYEIIFKKKVNPVVEQRINTIGFTFLIVLIMLITFSDILKLFR